MSLLQGIASLDRAAFLMLNGVWTHPSLDAVMPVVTDPHRTPWVAYGLAPAVLCLWLYREGMRAVRVLLVAAAAVGVCDLFVYRVAKPLAGRPRPEHAGIGARVFTPGGRLGFPSNHAANAGASAAVLSTAYPAAAPAFWALALLVAYSRVYVGAHYPLDVLAGLFIGALLAWPWAKTMLKSNPAPNSKR